MFITFEGPDGSGKSTQIKLLAERLVTAGGRVLLTREPGGTEISEQIRAILHDLKNKSMQPRAEILLYSAARAQLVAEKMKPHLAAGGLVLQRSLRRQHPGLSGLRPWPRSGYVAADYGLCD